MSSIEIRKEDYAEWDSDIVSMAGSHIMAEVQDIAFHCTNPGEGWSPWADEGDVLALIAEVRGHIERLEAAIKKARADLAGVERNARLAASRRQRAERKAEENS